MNRTIVITGSRRGIGGATRARLEAGGHRVIGVDLSDAEIVADLATVEGRDECLARIAELAPDRVDSVITCAGTSGMDDPRRVVSTNFFGTTSVISGLRESLLRSPAPRVVAIASTAALMPTDSRTVTSCLADDEQNARAAALAAGMLSYSSSKLAVATWVRRTAIRPTWGGSGILVNAVGPGATATPMTADLLATPESRAMLMHMTPTAHDHVADPSEQAEAIAFLATLEGRFVLGQVLFVDGGADAILRTEVV